jgi:hypothetical protein
MVHFPQDVEGASRIDPPMHGCNTANLLHFAHTQSHIPNSLHARHLQPSFSTVP